MSESNVTVTIYIRNLTAQNAMTFIEWSMKQQLETIITFDDAAMDIDTPPPAPDPDYLHPDEKSVPRLTNKIENSSDDPQHWTGLTAPMPASKNPDLE